MLFISVTILNYVGKLAKIARKLSDLHKNDLVASNKPTKGGVKCQKYS